MTNTDTAASAVVRPRGLGVRLPALRVRLRALRADEERMRAVRDSASALLGSRLLVWIAGVSTVAALGFGPHRGAFDPPGTTRGFGWLGDLLAAPAARWDSSWYLVIAHYGYRPDLGAFTASRTAFFPLYPLGLRLLDRLGPPPVVAGVLLSTVAFALALYGIHRLTTLELGGDADGRPGVRAEAAGVRAETASARAETAGVRAETADGGLGARAKAGEAARLAVLLTAFAPMAFFFSAVYSESLFLALSVGLFWAAREGRWWLAGVLGALAAATRSTGLVLLAPALMIYLYGPREDRPADRPREDGSREDRPAARSLASPSGAPRSAPSLLGRLRPRYRLRPSALWLALIPAGAGAFSLFLALGGGEALSPFHAQNIWGRHFAGPYLGVWDGLQAAFDGARQLLSFQTRHVYFTAAGGSPTVAAGHNLVLFAFLLAAIPALVAALRRLPLAYGVYAVAALALPLSYPVSAQPLMSLPRFLLVLFPLSIGAGGWLAEHPRARRPLLCCSAALMVVFLAQFATWHWVA